MKLRNKKTGQEGNFIINKDHFECVDLDYVPEYRNLAELNAEWEDDEESEEYWTIDRSEKGGLFVHKVAELAMLPERVECDEEYGIRFETEEAAVKAVEKLKALKRLNDRGVALHRFEGYESNDDLYLVTFSVRRDRYWSDRSHSVDADLNLLLGGGEE